VPSVPQSIRTTCVLCVMTSKGDSLGGLPFVSCSPVGVVVNEWRASVRMRGRAEVNLK
jgi:hypothetical protein